MQQEVSRRALYSIGQLAKLSHIGIKTLRYYDEQGILKPAEVDPVTGYRYYTPAQLEHARLLQNMRFVHMSVEVLREFMRDPTPQHQRQLFDGHLLQLQEEVDALNSRIQTLSRKRDYPWYFQEYDVQVEVRPSVPWVFLRYQVKLMRLEEAREAAFAEIREYLGHHRAEPASPPTCLSPSGGANRDEQQLISGCAGFEVWEPLPGGERIEAGRTPGGTWYGARHHGLYEYIGHAKAPIFQQAHQDGVPLEQGPADFIHSEVYRIGPWDTADLSKLTTDTRWLIRPEALGPFRSTP